MGNHLQEVGLVAIGRNEGSRLRQCLSSALNQVAQVVYVDSGSTDGSVELARSLGAEVVELDLSIPFTAARARNEGVAHLLQRCPGVNYVQFVDGDCEVVEGWLECAWQELTRNPQLAVVCGRRRERFPEKTIYNQLCDIEWDTPIGEAKACGGDAMMRVAAFQQVNGFNPALIAGEEPELCVRLRQRGWKILRLDAEMTRHDAQMTQLRQWWRRNLRAGYAYAEGAWMHGAPPERHWVRESRSIWLWGGILPALSLALAWPTMAWSLLLLLVYPLMVYRIYRSMNHQNWGTKAALAYAVACVLGKAPQFQGQVQFHRNRWMGRGPRIIEYKGADTEQIPSARRADLPNVDAGHHPVFRSDSMKS